MIAFLVLTNLQFINIINIKSTLYSNEKADLYVNLSNRISKEFMDTVQKSNLFSNIHILNATNTIKNVDFTKMFDISSIIGVFQEKNIYKTYFNQLSENKYSKIFIPHGFVPSRYFVLNLLSINPQMSIALFEEGTGSYCLTKKQLCSNFSPRIKSKIWHLYLSLRHPRLTCKFRKITDEIYLYQPQLYIDQNNLRPKKIPLINSNNTICWNLLITHSLSNAHASYNERSIVYFLQEQLTNKAQLSIMMVYLSILNEIMGSANIIIKKHPGLSNMDDTILNMDSNIYIDENVYIFESLFTHEYMKNKILISKESSAVITPKIMFGYEPYVIFTYKLYPDYYLKNCNRLNQLSLNLIDLYSDKTRIYIPNSVDEFKVILTALKTTLSVPSRQTD